MNPDPADAPFALLLTHDVDRPYKTYQSLYYGLTGKGTASRRYHLSTLRPGVNPYWQFGNLMALEDDLGVRSAFYFLTEQSLFEDRPVREWFTMEGWQLYAGRYDLRTDDRVRNVVHRLDDGGWEVGLHGSYETCRDRERLRAEKNLVEAVLGDEIVGGRQHYLNLEIPQTWKYYRDIGLSYDASLGSSHSYAFDDGYGVVRPFDDEFVVFPLTAMEQAFPDPGRDYERARSAVDGMLEEAAENRAVASVLFHPRHFAPRDFPNYWRLYEHLVREALDAGAWVGPPGDFYEAAGLADPGSEWE
jgi:hypothetical protein